MRRREIEIREWEVSELNQSDLEAFHKTAYGPGGMVVSVVGQVETAYVEQLLGEHFGHWAPAQTFDLPGGEINDAATGEERIQIDDRPNLDVYLGHRGKLCRGDEDYAAAILANACLGQSTLTSRLGVAVRDEAGLTYGINCRFFGTLEVPGLWATALGVSAENLDRAVALTRSVIEEYAAEGPTEAELADERSALAGSYRVGLATNSGVARELVTALAAGEAIARLDRFPEEVLAVTREEVVAAIRKHLHPDRLVMTAAGDFGD